MVFTQRGDGGGLAAVRCATVAVAARQPRWSQRTVGRTVSREEKLDSSGAVLYSMCTSSYPIGLESLLDFLPWDF